MAVFALVVAFTASAVRVTVGKGIIDAVRWVVLASVLGIALAGSRPRPAPVSRNDLPIGAVLLVMLAFSAASSFAHDPLLSFAKLIPMAGELVLFLFMLPRRLAPVDWSWLLARMRWLFAGLCAVALVIGVVHPVTVSRYPGGRLGSISNPNYVGMMAMVCIVLWLPLVLDRERRVARGYLLAGAAVTMAASTLWWTASRSSIGGCLAGAAVVALLERRSKWIGVLGGMGAAAVFAFPQAGQDAQQVIEARLMRGEDPLASREGVWEESIMYWRARPLLGHGYGVSSIEYAWSGSASAVGALRDGSGYLGLLESVGLVGASALAFLALALGQRALIAGRRAGKDRERISLLAVGSGVVAAFLVNAVGEPWFLGPGSLQQLMFWLGGGLIVSVAGWTAAERRAARRVARTQALPQLAGPASAPQASP